MSHIAQPDRGTEPHQVTWLRGLDGVRGVASMMVILAHIITFLIATDFAAPRLVSYTYVLCTQALTMFFCLSGLLLYRPFAKAILAGAPMPNLRDYYRGRVLRIYPANIVILVLAGIILGIAVLSITPHDAPGVEIGRLDDPVAILLNLTLLQGYFPDHVLTGLDASWSLVVEVAFYAVLPLLALFGMFVTRWIPRSWAIYAPALLLVAIGAPSRQIAYAQLRAQDVDYAATWSTVFQRSFLANCDLIGYGMFVAALVVHLRMTRDEGQLARRVVRGAALTIAIGLLLSGVFARDPDLTPFFGLACAGFLALISMPRPTSLFQRVQDFLELRPLHYLGVISYSTYLWHFVTILFLWREFPELRYTGYGSLLGLWVFVAAVSTVLGSATYHLVEAPAMKYSRAKAMQRKAAAASAEENSLKK